ncbi:hypothetical protein BD779DRAFT_603028 [Infundibulicybe gibba]|nr:hypothetical protein BD779DRAFT_603028 [Infundibulicybe gibba]
MASMDLHLDSKLGAAFLGNLAAAIFYGITCVQTFIYLKHGYARDKLTFRLLICFLWLLDTIHLAFVSHALYYYMISKYGILAALASPTWSILAQVYTTCISDLIARWIFGRRAWLMTGRSPLLAFCIAIPSLLTCATGIAFTSKAFIAQTFASFSSISYLLYISLGSGVVADAIIAATLCYTLKKNRTGFQKTDTIVNTLMIYTINTSLLTTLCSLACFTTYTIWPQEFTFIGIYFVLSKLYLNSLLATLNSRESLHSQAAGVVSDIPIGLSNISSTPTTSTSIVKHQYSPPDYSFRAPPVVINVNREIETRLENSGHERVAYAL